MTRIRTHDNRKLHVREIGRGPAVILLHGFGMESRHWLPVILPLARRFRFILPDLRGFGGSSRLDCSEDCVLTSHAQDLDAIIRHYSAGRPVHLGGISLGASTALRYMELFGTDSVKQYLHIDQSPKISHSPDWPWGIFGTEGPDLIAQWRPTLDALTSLPPETPFKRLPETVRRQFYRDLATFMDKAMSRAWLKWSTQQLVRVPALVHQLVPVDNWQTLLQHMRAYSEREYDFRPLLPSLSLPVTVMTGRKSEMYPWQGQQKMHELLPDSRWIVFEDSGHVPMIDQPRRFVRELEQALR